MVGDILKFAGKGLGIAGAVIMAGWDGYEAKQSWTAGHTGLAAAYGLSAVLGAGATWFLTLSAMAGATGIGLILIGLMFAVAVIIELVKDNEVQAWLERCLWGHGSSHYSTMEEEMTQLKSALA